MAAFLKRGALRRSAFVVLACLFYALGFQLFLDGNQIAAGGLAGIATVLTRILPISTSVLLIIMNIPLVLIAFFIKGWDFTKNSIGGFVIYTILIELTSHLPTLTDNMLLAAIYGGVFYGIGMALMTIGNGSIGGTELINRLLASLFPNIGLDGFCPMVDGSIVLFSMVMFHNVEVGLCAIITIFLCSKLVNLLVNRLIWGYRHGSLCLIITSDSAREVSDMLIERLGISVTKIDSVGMYANSQRSILMAAVRESETPQVKALLEENNVDNFVVVIPIGELRGGHLG